MIVSYFGNEDVEDVLWIPGNVTLDHYTKLEGRSPISSRWD